MRAYYSTGGSLMVSAPFPVTFPVPEATLAAAMAEVNVFARQMIRQRAYWRYFVATAGGQKSSGMWQLIRPGLEVILMTVDRVMQWPEPARVLRPTGAVVIEGSYIAKTVSSEVTNAPVQQTRRTGDKEIILAPIHHGIYPIGESCSLMVTEYRMGDHRGVLGILGPMRMDYSYNTAALDMVAGLLRHKNT
jgi:hypothetical protein